MQESKLTDEEKRSLPTCTSQTIGTDMATVLPDPPQPIAMEQLSHAIAKVSKKSNPLSWSAHLGTRSGIDGDPIVSDVLMDMSYLHFELYVLAFIHLAFLNKEDKELETSLLEIVRYPHGRKHSMLSRKVFHRMVRGFGLTCDHMKVSPVQKKKLVAHLKTFEDRFQETSGKEIGGLTTPHELGKTKCVQVEGMPLEASKKPSSCDSSTMTTSTRTSMGSRVAKAKWIKKLFGKSNSGS